MKAVGQIAAVGKMKAVGIGSWAGGMVAAVGQGSAAAVGQMAADGQLADGRVGLNICANKAMRQPAESNMGRDAVSGTG